MVKRREKSKLAVLDLDVDIFDRRVLLGDFSDEHYGEILQRVKPEFQFTNTKVSHSPKLFMRSTDAVFVHHEHVHSCHARYSLSIRTRRVGMAVSVPLLIVVEVKIMSKNQMYRFRIQWRKRANSGSESRVEQLMQP